MSGSDAEYRYRNALLWIRTLAGMHYLGGAFGPEHMRDLANVAANALAGADLPDFTERMSAALQEGRELAAKLGFDLARGDEEEDDDGDDGS